MTSYLTERIPSRYLQAARLAVKGLAIIKQDPNCPERIATIARLAFNRLDEHKLEIELLESNQPQRLTSSETQALDKVQELIDRTKHFKSICITEHKQAALQEEIDALETVVRLAKGNT